MNPSLKSNPFFYILLVSFLFYIYSCKTAQDDEDVSQSTSSKPQNSVTKDNSSQDNITNPQSTKEQFHTVSKERAEEKGSR